MSETIKKFDPLESGLSTDPYTQLQRIFVYFLQSLFEHEEFKGTGMWWDSDEKVTEMIISSEKPRLTVLEKTPHVTVIVGASQWAQLGLDQMQRRKMAVEERVHTDLISSTVSFHCQGKEGTHCRRMAWYSSQYTTMFRRLIMRQAKLHQIGMNHSISSETGPTAYLGKLSTEELVSVVVTIPFYWQPQWLIREPRSLLNRIETSLRVHGWRAKPFSVKGKPAYSIPIGMFQSFDEAKDAIQGQPAYTQVVLNSEN